jgi:FkbM family methyltransferase
MQQYEADVHSCLFPLIRLSKRAIVALYEERRSMSLQFKEGINPADFPNDESFTATVSQAKGFRCAALNDFGIPFTSPDTFSTARPLYKGEVRRRPVDNRVYHPVLSDDSFLKKTQWLVLHSKNKADLSRFAGYLETVLTVERDPEVHSTLDRQAKAINERLNSPLGLAPDLTHKQHGTLVDARYGEASARFFVRDPDEYMQRFHMEGRFYEDIELAALRRYSDLGGVFLDVGATIGNHAVFAARLLHAKAVIAVEPNPEAVEILRWNMSLNQPTAGSGVRLFASAFASRPGEGFIRSNTNNLGASRVTSKPEGGSVPVELVRGDDVLDLDQLERFAG